ncbi:succinate dehydrogenase, cytochrome b556 subunit [Oleiagrimonas soli]|uniref:Succinate dehydrogenase cytochrome b556 subunit n=1 Tax=Oleiagrimonas soli TaxID=1543381 RepID=A0A099CWK1_9GAMM|nr:succinate dehydrogenase, cytochrome b556 subunit [Oleiagrimonas soli]KGI78124.1 succinate dehydrogenase [Oleiagrimonas soli]MBB6183431.1 succinate dehydrogenase / fumarate reductase cytochrome b subunit [Oleiagrimonas soli]
MAQSGRPLSPHLGIYRWQVQMVTSILHRATGIALVAGALLVLWGLTALAAGPDAWSCFTGFTGSVFGLILLLGWTWALMFHLCNGVRHLLQDAGMGYEIPQFVRSSWLAVVVSLLLTVAIWAYLMAGGVL